MYKRQAYSPRPLPGAPVSMPVSWESLRDIVPGDFTVRTVPGLVGAQPDPWTAYDDAVGDLSLIHISEPTRPY